MGEPLTRPQKKRPCSLWVFSKAERGGGYPAVASRGPLVRAVFNPPCLPASHTSIIYDPIVSESLELVYPLEVLSVCGVCCVLSVCVRAACVE